MQEDQRRTAADRDEGGGRRHRDVDEPGDSVQAIELGTGSVEPPLPEQVGQDEKTAGPYRDRGDVNEFEERRHWAWPTGCRLVHRSFKPMTR